MSKKTVPKFDGDGYFVRFVVIEQAPGGGYHIPQDCLDVVMELQENKIAKRSGGNISWEDDYRGRSVWECSTLTKSVMSEIGAVTYGWTLLEPSAFQKWEGEGWVDDIEKYRDELLSIAVAYCAENEDYEIRFTLEDAGENYYVTLNERYIRKISLYEGKEKQLKLKARKVGGGEPKRFALNVPTEPTFTVADLQDRDVDNFEFLDGHTDAIRALETIQEITAYRDNEVYKNPIAVLGVTYELSPASTPSNVDVTAWKA